MANLVKNILELLSSATDWELGWSALPKIGDAVFTFHENSQASDYMDIMREKSQAAYDAYCQDWKDHARGDSIGIPDKKAVLDYWPHCMETETLPNSRDFASFANASAEEAEQMLKFLVGQWLTVSDFTVWLHGIATRLKLDEIARTLDILPRMEGMIRRIEEGLKALSENGRGVAQMQFITYSSVMAARSVSQEAREEDIRNYYRISNNYPTMFRVISAGQDIPHQAACAKLDELLRGNKPVIIAGNGGLGKSSLMLREAVLWAESGGIALWLPLSASGADAVSESQAAEFYRILTASVPDGAEILLCVDNPYDGRKSLENLQNMWPGKGRIRLLMAERSNRLSILGDQSKDRLQGWFDNACVLELLGAKRTGDSTWSQERDYQYLPFPEESDRRRRILDACVTAFAKDIPEAERAQILARVLRNYDRPNVSLAELIYRTLFELRESYKLSQNVSKTKSIMLDWDEWERFIQEETNQPPDSDMYALIAAFKLFDTPLTLSFFCRFFELNKRRLRGRLQRRHMHNQIEPLVYDEDRETLQPKHDVIAELFFLFHKDTVFINRLTEDIIEEMDSEETEILLDQMVDKQEFLRGSVYQIDIHYQDYLDQIRKRIESGRITLGPGSRANLCTGTLWLEMRRTRRQAAERAGFVDNEQFQMKMRAYLTENAPKPESNLPEKELHGMCKLYMEWGLWERNTGNLEEAKKRFQDILIIDPTNIPPRTELGRLLAGQRGREAEAEEVFRKALDIDPNNIPIRTELGRLLAGQRGREAEAEEVFRKALDIKPNNIPPRILLAKLYKKQRKFSEAEKQYQKVCRINPKDRRAVEALAHVRWLKKYQKKYRNKSPRWEK